MRLHNRIKPATPPNDESVQKPPANLSTLRPAFPVLEAIRGVRPEVLGVIRNQRRILNGGFVVALRVGCQTRV